MRAEGEFSIDQVVVGHSPRMRAIFDFVRMVSRSDSTVRPGGAAPAATIRAPPRRSAKPSGAVSATPSMKFDLPRKSATKRVAGRS